MNILNLLPLLLLSCIYASETKNDDGNESKEDLDGGTKAIGDYTAYLLWYMTPSTVRKEITRHIFRYASVSVVPQKLSSIVLQEDRDRIIKPSEFLRQIHYGEKDWIRLAEKYLLRSRAYNLVSQMHLLVEIFKRATPKTINILLNSFKIAFYLEFIPSSKLVQMITESRSSGEDIISILNIMERRFENFNIGEPDHLQLIRRAAFRLDDCRLMKYTDSFPGLIPASYTCQKDFVDCSLIGDKIPELWGMFCDIAPSENTSCQVKSCDQFVKFRLFDAPVNTKGWHPCMWAIACQDYKKAEKLPMRLVKLSSGQLPPAAIGSISVQQLIRMIPDDVHRENIRKKFKNEGKVVIPAEKDSEFNCLAGDGQQIRVQVLDNRSQSGAAAVLDSIPSFDTEAFVHSILEHL